MMHPEALFKPKQVRDMHVESRGHLQFLVRGSRSKCREIVQKDHDMGVHSIEGVGYRGLYRGVGGLVPLYYIFLFSVPVGSSSLSSDNLFLQSSDTQAT